MFYYISIYMNIINSDIYRNKGFHLLDALSSQGKRTFTNDEAQAILGISKHNVMAILGHLRRQQHIVTLTQGLYAVLPPSQRRHGLHSLPVLDSLMRHRHSPYYIGLLSAADYFGATHYKPQVLQVIVPKQLPLRRANTLGIRLYVAKHFSDIGITKIKHPSGYIAFSTPALTMLDLVQYASQCGGLNNVYLVIQTLAPQVQRKALAQAIAEYHYASAIQRLGFLLEQSMVDDKLIRVLRQWTKKHRLSRIALSTQEPKRGPVHPAWQVIVNTTLEEPT